MPRRIGCSITIHKHRSTSAQNAKRPSTGGKTAYAITRRRTSHQARSHHIIQPSAIFYTRVKVAITTVSPRRRPHGAAIFVAFFIEETDQIYGHSSLIDPIENILSFSTAAPAISNLPSPNGSVAIATVSHSMMQKARLSMLRSPSPIKVRSRKSSTRYNGNSPTGPRADNNCPTNGQIKRFKTNHDRIIQKQHGVFTDSQYSEFDLVSRSQPRQFYEYDEIVSSKGSADDSDHLKCANCGKKFATNAKNKWQGTQSYNRHIMCNNDIRPVLPSCQTLHLKSLKNVEKLLCHNPTRVGRKGTYSKKLSLIIVRYFV